MVLSDLLRCCCSRVNAASLFQASLFDGVIHPSLSCNFISRRNYRGRRTHNIGRIHGLDKPEPPPVAKKLVGVWNASQHESAEPNHYNTINFLISGYDLVLVENFSKFVHRLLIRYKQNLGEIYALPANETHVKHMNQVHQRSVEQMDLDTVLVTYKRVIQVKELSSQMLPVLLQALMFNVPQSVTFTVNEHSESDLAIRYKRRMELEQEMEDLDQLIKSK